MATYCVHVKVANAIQSFATRWSTKNNDSFMSAQRYAKQINYEMSAALQADYI